MDNMPQKTIDVLLYGNMSSFYPFRNRLLKLIQTSNINYHYLEHPGYNDYVKTTDNLTINTDLCKLIQKSKITIVTCSVFEYFVKKYIEVSLSGSLICGNFPSTEKNIFKNSMCLLEPTMSDEDIVAKIQKLLNLPYELIHNMIITNQNIALNNYTYTQGLTKFTNIINYIK